MNKLLIILLLLSFYCAAQTDTYQNVVVFVNKENSKSKTIEAGSHVLLLYTGYLSQEEIIHASILTVTDSSLIIVKNKNSPFEHQSALPFEIMLKDLLGFKKVTPGRTLLKALSKLTLGVGAALVFSGMNKNGANFWASFGTSAGIGAVGDIGIEFIFKDRIKYKLADGWQFRVIKF